MTQREVYNTLVGDVITFDDGTQATIVKYLSRKSMYNELFKRYLKYENVEKIKKVNRILNENIEELLEHSERLFGRTDEDERHKVLGIKSFENRMIRFYDGKNAYDFTISIAVMQDGSKIAYAKKYLQLDEELQKKIQKIERTSRKSRFNQSSVSSKTTVSQNKPVVNNKSKRKKHLKH